MKINGMFRNLGMFVLETLFAVIGPAVVESPFDKIFRLHQGTTIVLRTWGFSIVCATLTAFFLYKSWRNATAKWVWILPGIWFALGVFAFRTSYSQSVLRDTSWAHFSGMTCSNLDLKACRDFFAFTIPFIRAVSYSCGTLLASQVYGRPLPSHSLAEASRAEDTCA